MTRATLRTGAVKKGPAATPYEIHGQMNRFIIGQEKEKKILSVVVYNHAKRLKDRSGLIKKSNILLAGPSGCGKTLLAKTLAKTLDLPFAIADASSMTQTGYIGDDEICLQRLLDAAGGDIELAQKGIVFLDEIDKIACKDLCGRDIGGESVQAELLKLVEGSKVSILADGNKRSLDAKSVTMDTRDILFVCGGAFDGLISGQRNENHTIGFSADRRWEEPVKDFSIGTKELIKYGMMPELIGRFPVICTLDCLRKEDLICILTEPEDAIVKEYELLLKKDGIRLVFEQEALEEIAGIAIKRKTGARGLRSVIEDLMLDIMYDMPGRTDISKCIITADSIKTRQPVLIKKKAGKRQTEGYVDSEQSRQA